MILVTGGTGLVGSHLLYELLLKKENVIAIYRKSSDLNVVKNVFSYYSDEPDSLFDLIRWEKADILDIVSLSEIFKNIKYVYHCAALISFEPSKYLAMRKVNIEGTANIVNLCIENHIKKLCYVSSIAAIGKEGSATEVTENNEWQVKDNNFGYAISKYGAETEVWRASQEGIDVVIVNPGVILGPGFWDKGSGKIFGKIYNGFKYYTTGITGFVGIYDVVSVMIGLMKSGITNERFILVSENKSYKAVFSEIAYAFNRKAPNIYISKFFMGLLWKISWLKVVLFGGASILTKQSARAACNYVLYSNKKIKKALVFDFETIEQVIGSTCKNYCKDLS
jgi:nucleoside-diphosphate-sugar epimerase